MILSGIVSVTFRQLKPEQIAELASRAGLEGIEWGGDVHVPHGDIKTAREVHRLTVGNGLKVASYGSYYRVGCSDEGLDRFKRILETAVELNSPNIRVWAGDRGSASSDESWWNNVIARSREIAELSETANITVSYEYHGNTLTDTNESTLRLLRAVGHKNLRCYWQPPVGLDFEQRKEGLANVAGWLTNIHVFHWTAENGDIIRHPLEEGKLQWSEYLNNALQIKGDHFALLEFVKDDNAEQFLQDAEVLKKIIRDYSHYK